MLESSMSSYLVAHPLAWVVTIMTMIVAIEAVTEIIVQAEIFTDLRGWIARKGPKLEYLVTCGYCTSVWVAGLCTLAAPSMTGFWFIDMPVIWFAMHRMANQVHEGFSRWLSREPWSVVHTHIHPKNTGKRRSSK